MLENLFGPNAQRKRALKKATHPIMQQFLSVPFAEKNNAWQDCELVSLDLETSGLNTARDHILSFGMVDIVDSAIRLDTARHQLIKTSRPLKESSVIVHHITDDLSGQGIAISQAIEAILQHLAGKIMLVHFRRIEQQFLDSACRKLYGTPFIVPTIDTMHIAESLLIRENHTIIANELRLFNLLRKYHLPQYRAHDALYDALSTAELFLAMASDIQPQGKCSLKNFLI